MNTALLAVLLVFGFPIIIVAGFFVVWALKIYKGDGRRDEQLQAEETKLIQELHQGLLKMEQRIESLETLLLDPDRKDH